MPVKLDDLNNETLKTAVLRAIDRKLTRQIAKLKNVGNLSSNLLDTRKRLESYLDREARLFNHPNSSKHKNTNGRSTANKAALNQPNLIGLERKLSDQNNILSIEFLDKARQASQAVVRINTPIGSGTGVFVAPNIILTNHHVISSDKIAERSDFDVFAEQTTVEPDFASDTLYFSPSTFFYSNKELDIAFIAVEDESLCESCGWLPLIEEIGKILIGHPVNVIQHPSGGDKKIVVHNSLLLELDDRASASNNFCWYSADTEEGSSGSPVFNNRWEIIAIHHQSIPATNKNNELLDINGKVISKERLQENPDVVNWIANEGIRTSKIVAHLRQAQLSSDDHSILRDRILNLWSDPKSFRPGIKKGWFE